MNFPKRKQYANTVMIESVSYGRWCIWSTENPLWMIRIASSDQSHTYTPMMCLNHSWWDLSPVIQTKKMTELCLWIYALGKCLVISCIWFDCLLSLHLNQRCVNEKTYSTVAFTSIIAVFHLREMYRVFSDNWWSAYS